MGKFRISSNEKLLEIEVSGPLLQAEILKVIEEWYPQVVSTRILWDLSKADVHLLTEEDYVKIAVAARSKLPSYQSRRTAYVVADAKAFLKQWSYVERAALIRVGAEYSVFTGRESAERWLGLR